MGSGRSEAVGPLSGVLEVARQRLAGHLGILLCDVRRGHGGAARAADDAEHWVQALVEARAGTLALFEAPLASGSEGAPARPAPPLAWPYTEAASRTLRPVTRHARETTYLGSLAGLGDEAAASLAVPTAATHPLQFLLVPDQAAPPPPHLPAPPGGASARPQATAQQVLHRAFASLEPALGMPPSQLLARIRALALATAAGHEPPVPRSVVPGPGVASLGGGVGRQAARAREATLAALRSGEAYGPRLALRAVRSAHACLAQTPPLPPTPATLFLRGLDPVVMPAIQNHLLRGLGRDGPARMALYTAGCTGLELLDARVAALVQTLKQVCDELFPSLLLGELGSSPASATPSTSPSPKPTPVSSTEGTPGAPNQAQQLAFRPFHRLIEALVADALRTDPGPRGVAVAVPTGAGRALPDWPPYLELLLQSGIIHMDMPGAPRPHAEIRQPTAVRIVLCDPPGP